MVFCSKEWLQLSLPVRSLQCAPEVRMDHIKTIVIIIQIICFNMAALILMEVNNGQTVEPISSVWVELSPKHLLILIRLLNRFHSRFNNQVCL